MRGGPPPRGRSPMRRGYSPPPDRGYGRPPPGYHDYREPPYYDERRYDDRRRGASYYREYDDRRNVYHHGGGGRPPYREQYRNRRPRYNPSYDVDPTDLAETTDLFVGNLPPHFREDDLYNLFEKCGKVLNVTLGTNRRTGMSQCYAFVKYETRRDAEEAFNYFQDKTYDGRTIRIDWDIGHDKKARKIQRHRRYMNRHSPDRGYRRSRSRERDFSPGRGPMRGGGMYGRSRSPIRRVSSRSPGGRITISRSPPRRRGEEFEKRSRSPGGLESPDHYKKPKLDD